MKAPVGRAPQIPPMQKFASQSQLTEYNMAFYDTIRKEAESDKIAEQLGSMLKAQIYESSTLEQFHPPADLDWSELDKDENPENVFKIKSKEYLSPAAIQLTFRGQAYFERVETDRFRINATRIASPEFYLIEHEVRTYDQPIENVLRTQIAFHMRKQIDALWYGSLNEALAAYGNQQVIDLTGTGVYTITPEVIVQAINLLDGRGVSDGLYLSAFCLVMARSQYNYVYTWLQSNGIDGAASLPGVQLGNIGAEWLEKGYTGSELAGRKVLTTIKNDLLPENIIFILSQPEFMGYHFTLRDEKFMVRKEFDKIMLKGMRYFMYGIGNVYSVAKIILDVRS